MTQRIWSLGRSNRRPSFPVNSLDLPSFQWSQLRPHVSQDSAAQPCCTPGASYRSEYCDNSQHHAASSFTLLAHLMRSCINLQSPIWRKTANSRTSMRNLPSKTAWGAQSKHQHAISWWSLGRRVLRLLSTSRQTALRPS